MQFFFIRHAQSFNNALWTRTGSDTGRSEDPELTEIGYRQAGRLAEFLRQGRQKTNTSKNPRDNYFQITHLYTSLMVRAVMTGKIIAEALDVPLVAWEELHERGGIYLADPETGEKNCLPGKSRSYFAQHFPGLKLPDSMGDAGWWNFRPYETPEICIQRAQSFLKGLLDRHGNSEDHVAVISHGGFYNDFLRVLLDLTGREGNWFSMYNTAITRIDFQTDFIELVYQNRVDHLPNELIT
jgi:2,3-bisphosphoglycerate-dependent phosphoglycerate mutase